MLKALHSKLRGVWACSPRKFLNSLGLGRTISCVWDLWNFELGRSALESGQASHFSYF